MPRINQVRDYVKLIYLHLTKDDKRVYQMANPMKLSQTRVEEILELIAFCQSLPQLKRHSIRDGPHVTHYEYSFRDREDAEETVTVFRRTDREFVQVLTEASATFTIELDD